jgi:hypothetical protein
MNVNNIRKNYTTELKEKISGLSSRLHISSQYVLNLINSEHSIHDMNFIVKLIEAKVKDLELFLEKVRSQSKLDNNKIF